MKQFLLRARSSKNGQDKEEEAKGKKEEKARSQGGKTSFSTAAVKAFEKVAAKSKGKSELLLGGMQFEGVFCSFKLRNGGYLCQSITIVAYGVG